MPLRTYNLALIGFGNVGRTFVSLLSRKREQLREDHSLGFRFTGVATRTYGWLIHPEGFSSAQLLGGDFAGAARTDSLQTWLLQAKPDAVFGNSIHDLAMLEIAANPFPVNPSPALLEAAAKNGWGYFVPRAAKRVESRVRGE